MFWSTALFDPLVVYLALFMILVYAVLCVLSVVIFFKKGRKVLFLLFAVSFVILAVVGLGSFYFEPVLDWSYYYLVVNWHWLKYSLDYMINAQQEVWLVFQSFHFPAIAVFGLAMILAGKRRGELVKEGDK